MSQAQVDPNGSQPSDERSLSERRAGVGASTIVLIFALWTLFVWGGRLRNLWLDPGGFAEASRWSLVGSIVFTALGLAVVGVWLASRFGSGANLIPRLIERIPVFALAGLTTVVWLIRAVDIALGDHSVAFIAVHVVLAVISIGLAVMAVAALTRSTVG